MKTSKRITMLGLGAVASMAAVAFVTAQTVAATSAPIVQDDEKQTQVTLVLANGQTVTGILVSESAAEIVVMIETVVGSHQTSYKRSDIVSMTKGEVEKVETPRRGAERTTGTGSASRAPVRGALTGPGADMDDPDTVYYMEFTGEFGRDVAMPPLQEIVRDIKRHQPDIIVIKLDHEYKVYGEDQGDWNDAGAGFAFNQLETVRQMETLFTSDMAKWDHQPRLVFWVEKALGGSAFLPFVSPDMYFTSNGRHGNIGFLETIFGQTGDEVVREKQFSLRMGRAEGLLLKGGYDPRIVRAMARTAYVLSYKMVGGKAEFYERMPDPNNPGEILLTDDGDRRSGNADSMQDVARFRGNDVLTLDSETALKLGVAKGIADEFDDLMYELGIDRTYAKVNGRADQVLARWQKGVTDAEYSFRRLWRDYARINVRGDLRERRAARSQQIRVLRDIQALLDRYGMAINPREIQGAPDQWESQINLMIEQIRQAMRRDR